MKTVTLIVAFMLACFVALPAGVACTQTATKPAAPAVSSNNVNAAQLLEDVRALSSDAMEGRKFGTPAGARARGYVARRFVEAGLKPFFGEAFEQAVTHTEGGKTTTGANVVGFVRGKSNPSRLLVVTAHYDHLGVKDGKVYNGADDNASGVAALLQLAARFSREPPENSIVFAALDAEEGPGAGARTLVKSLKEAKRNVRLNVNLDMVSHSDRGELYAAGTYHYPFLRPYIEQVAARAPIKLLMGHDRPEQGQDDWTKQSDHYAFHREKIPFIYFGVEDHKDYHQPTDDFETITQEFFVRAAETILDMVRTLDGELTNLEKEMRK